MHILEEEVFDGLPPAHKLDLGFVGNPKVTLTIYTEEDPEDVNFSFYRAIRPIITNGAEGTKLYPKGIPTKEEKRERSYEELSQAA